MLTLLTYGLAGLSPRGRGKHIAAIAAALIPRSIPAWAGETIVCDADFCKRTVYPRVGGGNTKSYLGMIAQAGLSPRGRGKPPRGIMAPLWTGSIPAWAGETIALTAIIDIIRVYPRVGGGNRYA